MSLTVKAYFKDEIRRINIDGTSASSFEYLEGKVRTAFPSLPPKNRLIFKWKDSDDDLVTISTDEELIEALTSAENGVFKLYLDKKVPQGTGAQAQNLADHLAAPIATSADMVNHLGKAVLGTPLFNAGAAEGNEIPVHNGITCDDCNMTPIMGNRYKCKVRPDFDLCQICFDKETEEDKKKYKKFEKPAQTSGFGGFMGHRGGFGHPFRGRWGHGRRSHHAGNRCNNESSDEDAKPWRKFKAQMTAEERQQFQKVVTTIKEAAKKAGLELAGASAGDCCGEMAVVAVRSSIRKAKIIEKTFGIEPKMDKKKKRKGGESSSDSDSSSSDEELIDPSTAGSSVPTNMNKKTMKKRFRATAKQLMKLTEKEVGENFGKLAAKMAGKAVAQSLMITCKNFKRNEKQMQRKASNASGKFPNKATVVPEQPQAMLIDDELFGFEQLSVNTPPAPAPEQQQQPIYPEVPVNPPASAPELETEEDKAVNEAVRKFIDMGYEPDMWLLAKIREAKGDIQRTFELLRQR